jgi:hypothetical protein
MTTIAGYSRSSARGATDFPCVFGIFAPARAASGKAASNAFVIHRLKSMSELLCPRCEKPLGPEHDEKACERKMSRRFFFGVAFGGLMAAVAKQAPVGPITLPELSAYMVEGITPVCVDTIFQTSPLFFRLKDSDYRHFYSGGWMGVRSLLKP